MVKISNMPYIVSFTRTHACVSYIAHYVVVYSDGGNFSGAAAPCVWQILANSNRATDYHTCVSESMNETTS